MAVPETAVLQTVASLDTLIAVIECQQPEADLYRYGIVVDYFLRKDRAAVELICGLWHITKTLD